ncbi:MAG: NAD(P)H-hydrate dehydratase [Clostridiales Family XIII bacterium]|jgi:NAD(P)H-hydrate epimerase|nr:NAD(P)H-hydrate dehydratase [Clostridiales Family XIII bacterium]
MKTITKQYVKALLKKRARDAHKGDCGRVLIVAGSPGMAGAAVLGAMGALRSGAGLVSVATDEALFPIVQTCVPCATCIGRTDAMREPARWDAMVVGPGLGTGRRAEETVKTVMEAYRGRLIVDADALNIIAAAGLDIRNAKADVIITPHAGEAARLLGTDAGRINADREGSARALAKRFDVTAVLKGSETLVALPDGEIRLNPTGNPGMATGGSGDVLAGVIASFAGQGLGAPDAASAGVYIHGLAGDVGANGIGEYGLIATDVANALPAAIRTVQKSGG